MVEAGSADLETSEQQSSVQQPKLAELLSQAGQEAEAQGQDLSQILEKLTQNQNPQQKPWQKAYAMRRAMMQAKREQLRRAFQHEVKGMQQQARFQEPFRRSWG